MHYVEIDIEQDPALAENAGVNGTPTVQARGGGAGLPARLLGLQLPDAAALRAWLARLPPWTRSSPASLPPSHPTPPTPSPHTWPQIFKDKALVESLPGVKMKSQYRGILDKLLGAPVSA